MKIHDVLAALTQQWDEVRAQLNGEQLGQLTELVAALVAETIPTRLVPRANRIIEFLADVLPDGHPILLILEEPASRLATDHVDRAELAEWLPLIESLRGKLPTAARTPTIEEVSAGASAWLLAAESLTENEVRARGHNVDDLGLIRLERPEGSFQWPAFQFGPDNAVPELVRTINRILDAADDPWGAADWWLGENTWLAGIPARLIGHVEDRVLTRAALDERAEG